MCIKIRVRSKSSNESFAYVCMASAFVTHIIYVHVVSLYISTASAFVYVDPQLQKYTHVRTESEITCGHRSMTVRIIRMTVKTDTWSVLVTRQKIEAGRDRFSKKNFTSTK